MKLLLYTFLIFLFNISDTIAQENRISWRKRAKLALDYEKNGDLYNAAVLYQGIYEEKTDKPEYSFRAGVCFLELRDYQSAIKYLEVVKNDNDKYDKPGYKYSLALKQAGQPAKAKNAFISFLNNYQGDDKNKYKEIVENEIKGCNYALKAKEFTNTSVTVMHLSSIVNSATTEFAPIPFSENVLYFSSISNGNAKIQRTTRQQDGWTLPQIPSIFEGNMVKSHFGNGSFSEDGKRFYFTQCDIVSEKPECAIYFMERIVENKWSDPIKLPDYINPDNVNTTHPCVVSVQDGEILYFSSNRSGGRGGLDLWYTTRKKNGKLSSFTLPRNLGRNINSPGDEISPFYHPISGVLYYSSNGRVSAGGLDIFKSRGQKLHWEVSQNLGFPVNSSADDLYYTISEPHGGGYLVSNRPFPPERSTTTDDDIFYFGVESVSINIGGSVYINQIDSSRMIRDVNVRLFKISSNLDEELIDEKLVSKGRFYFDNLEPDCSYLVLFNKADYEEFNYSFATLNQSVDLVSDIYMSPLHSVVSKSDVISSRDIMYFIMPAEHHSNETAYQLPIKPIDPLSGLLYTGDTLATFYEFDAIAGLGDSRKLFYDESGIPQPFHLPVSLPEEVSGSVDGPYEPSDISPSSVSYKIQVSAVRNFKADKFKDLKQIGRLFMEDIDGGLKRILVINKEKNVEGIDGFKRKSDALNVLSFILNNTRFDYAFVVKYVNGERVGDGFRGWNEEEGLETDSRPDGYIPKDSYDGF